MIENIRLFAAVSAKSALKWLLVFGIGTFCSLSFMAITLICVNRETSGKLSFISDYFHHDFPAFLIVCCLPVFVILYYLCANKMAVDTAIFETWKRKGESQIRPVAAAQIERVTGHERIDRIASPALLRVKLVDAVRQSSESKIKKRIIGYAFQKIRLDDIDFSADNLKLSDVLAQKFTNFISDAAAPSWLLFWILFAVQTLIFAAGLAIG